MSVAPMVHLMATWGGLLAPLLFSVLSLAGPEPPGNTYIRSVAIHFTVTIKCTAVLRSIGTTLQLFTVKDALRCRRRDSASCCCG